MNQTATPANIGSMEGLGGMGASGCKCESCVSACESKPGWFLPGEAEKAAALLGLGLPEFFRQRLMIDWWENWDGLERDEDDRHVFALSPALVGETAGEEAPGDPRGRCVFLKNGLCEIHAAKPHECRMWIHGESQADGDKRKRAITAAWAGEQPQIEALLGREPVAAEFYGSSPLWMWP